MSRSDHNIMESGSIPSARRKNKRGNRHAGRSDRPKGDLSSVDGKDSDARQRCEGTTPPTSRSLTCPICDKVISRTNLNAHIRSMHADIDIKSFCQKKPRGRPKSVNGPKPRRKVKREPVICSACGKTLSKASNLKRHIRFMHSNERQAEEQEQDGEMSGVLKKKRKRVETRMKCPVCRSSVQCERTMPDLSHLIRHLNDSHSQTIAYHDKTFESEGEFNEWMTQIQRDTPCTFIKVGRRILPLKRTYYYGCSRSGTTLQPSRTAADRRKRCAKQAGGAKVEYACPAHVKCTVVGTRYSIRYVANHYCYTDRLEQLGKLRMSKEDRMWLAEKLEMGIPVDTILREAHSGEGGELLRRNIVTKSDLRNICLSFGLRKPECTDNETSFDALVREYGSAEGSPIILYKPQGATNADFFFDELNVRDYLPSDFMFGFMDKTQCDMLKAFGHGDHGVVFVNSTHGNNADDFRLTTVSVLDTNRQGFPVAFLYSNRDAEDVLEIFFASIKARSGVIVPNSFMSEMAPDAYDAWQLAMGTCNNRLYCALDVDKAVRENLRLHVGSNTELILQVCKQIRTLMNEPDVANFEASMRNYLYILTTDSATAEFAQFFQATYMPYAQSWAYCYRAHCGVNADMAFERMRSVLSLVYHRIKNKSLDIAIRTLIHRIFYDRLASLCKGKYSKKLIPLHRRHLESLELDVMCAELVADEEWLVQSEDVTHELYIVRRCKISCSCDMQCRQCRACNHCFTCTCFDFVSNSNMCKHIHFVCNKFISNVLIVTPNEAVKDCHILPKVELSEADEVTFDESDAAAYIGELVDQSAYSDNLRDCARKLTAEIAELVDTVADGDLIGSVIEPLRAVRSTIEGLSVSR